LGETARPQRPRPASRSRPSPARTREWGHQKNILEKVKEQVKEREAALKK
jgi:hypothetical protein